MFNKFRSKNSREGKPTSSISARSFPQVIGKIWAVIAFGFVLLILCINFTRLGTNLGLFVVIPYLDTPYKERAANGVGAIIDGLDYTSQHFPVNSKVTLVGDEPEGKKAFSHYWLYPRSITYSTSYEEATSGRAEAILVILSCKSAECEDRQTDVLPPLENYTLLAEFRRGNALSGVYKRYN